MSINNLSLFVIDDNVVSSLDLMIC